MKKFLSLIILSCFMASAFAATNNINKVEYVIVNSTLNDLTLYPRMAEGMIPQIAKEEIIKPGETKKFNLTLTATKNNLSSIWFTIVNKDKNYILHDLDIQNGAVTAFRCAENGNLDLSDCDMAIMGDNFDTVHVNLKLNQKG